MSLSNPNPLTLILVLLFVSLTGVLLRRTPDAAAHLARACTTQPQAGIAQVQIGEDGVALKLVPLAMPFCGAYSVAANPQGSGAEFAVTTWFVDTHNNSDFVIGAIGTPNTTVTFQWLALTRTQ